MYNRGGEFKYCTFGAFKLLTIKSCARHEFREYIMIKNILATMALLSLPICAKAQDLPLVLSDHNEVGILPGYFTFDEEDQLYTYPLNEKYEGSGNYVGIQHINLYDTYLNPIRSITAESGIIPFLHYRGRDKNFLYVTQTIFDRDDKYEYISAQSFDDIFKNAKGIKIQNEDGKILAEIPFEDKWMLSTFYNKEDDIPPIRIFHLFGLNHEQSYLCLDLWRNNSDYDHGEECITRIYAFEEGKISSSIKKVKDIPSRMKVNPTLPQKNETIKVNLGDMKSAQKLYVVDTNGKVCFTQSIQPGQENVELSTSGMPAGMYIIRVSDGNKDVDNCRVIIR